VALASGGASPLVRPSPSTGPLEMVMPPYPFFFHHEFWFVFIAFACRHALGLADHSTLHTLYIRGRSPPAPTEPVPDECDDASPSGVYVCKARRRAGPGPPGRAPRAGRGASARRRVARAARRRSCFIRCKACVVSSRFARMCGKCAVPCVCVCVIYVCGPPAAAPARACRAVAPGTLKDRPT